MKILIDTDVLLDVALRRPEFFENSAAIAFGADRIVTRNLLDYRKSAVRVVSPAEFVEISK